VLRNNVLELISSKYFLILKFVAGILLASIISSHSKFQCIMSFDYLMLNSSAVTPPFQCL
jgi:hypothetical protein